MNIEELLEEIRAMRTILGWLASYQTAMQKCLQARGIVSDEEIVQVMNTQVRDNALVIEALMKQQMGESDG